MNPELQLQTIKKELLKLFDVSEAQVLWTNGLQDDTEVTFFIEIECPRGEKYRHEVTETVYVLTRWGVSCVTERFFDHFIKTLRGLK